MNIGTSRIRRLVFAEDADVIVAKPGGVAVPKHQIPAAGVASGKSGGEVVGTADVGGIIADVGCFAGVRSFL